jgi:hypothetical protein
MISPSIGTQQLFDANTKKVVGVSDFSERVLAPSEVLIIEKIRIGYDTNDDAGKEAALTYGKILSTSFRNAVLRIRQNGDVKYEISLSDLQNKYTGDSLESDIVTLNIPVVLVGGADIKLELEFAEGAMPVALKKEYLEFAFKGQKVTR